jgi:FemAB family protein
MNLDKYQVIIKSSGIAQSLNDKQEDWISVISSSEYLPVSYLLLFNQYMESYMKSSLTSYYNLSQVLYEGDNPVGVWPLCIYEASNNWVIGSNDGAVIPPLFIKRFGDKGRKSVIEKCLQILDELCELNGQKYWAGNESIRENGISQWHRKVMEKGASQKAGHELYVDMSMDISKIKSSIRKSYKSLITRGNEIWRADLYCGKIEHEVFREFQTLHFQVAGRATRSQDTWDYQERAINDGTAFLIALKDIVGRMVGGGFFYLSKDEGLYAVGAYDRTLFDQPLGHVVQNKAIEYMKERGVRWYKIGYRFYAQDNPTDKELSIAYFKEGFATHIFLNTFTQCPVRYYSK